MGSFASSSRRRASAVAVAVAAAALVASGTALAAAPPTILTAGIDASDHLYATWKLGVGTTYDHVGFATRPEPDPLQPGFFISANVAAFGCPIPPDTCTGTPSSTSFRSSGPVARDRRYFVKVTALAGKGDYATSPVWVIDETKPQRGGKPPSGPAQPTNVPVAGRPSIPPQVPSASIAVLSPPTTVGALLASGVRVRVTCKRAPCTAAASLARNGRPLTRRGALLASGSTRTIVLRPSAATARRLRARSRTRLKISATVAQKGRTQRVSRLFTVRR